MDFRIWWEFYHVHSLTNQQSKEFKDMINEGVKHLSCLKCQKDAASYLKRHYWNSNVSMLFKLHNGINIRLKKPIFRWKDMTDHYGNRSEKELLDLNWRFIMMIYKVSKSRDELEEFFESFISFFGYNISVDRKLLHTPQHQFHIYSIYLALGGSVPFEDMVLHK